MGGKLDKLVAGVTDDLEPGEEILAAVKGIPDGEAEAGILGAAGGVSLGAAGLLYGGQLGDSLGEERRAGTDAAGVASSKGKQVAVVLTDRRILVFTVGFSGKAKECLGVIPRSDIAEMALGTTSLFGQKMPLVSVTTNGGHTAGFGVAKIHKAKATAFVDAYRASAI